MVLCKEWVALCTNAGIAEPMRCHLSSAWLCQTWGTQYASSTEVAQTFACTAAAKPAHGSWAAWNLCFVFLKKACRKAACKIVASPHDYRPGIILMQHLWTLVFHPASGTQGNYNAKLHISEADTWIFNERRHYRQVLALQRALNRVFAGGRTMSSLSCQKNMNLAIQKLLKYSSAN